jgi:hypothetical protein
MDTNSSSLLSFGGIDLPVFKLTQITRNVQRLELNLDDWN